MGPAAQTQSLARRRAARLSQLPREESFHPAPPRFVLRRHVSSSAAPTLRAASDGLHLPLASASPGLPFHSAPASLEPSLSLQLPKSGSLPHVARRSSLSFGWAPPRSDSSGRRVLHLAIQGAPAGILAASGDAGRPLRRCANNRLVLTLRSAHGPARFGLHLTTRCDHVARAAQPQSLAGPQSHRARLPLPASRSIPYVVYF